MVSKTAQHSRSPARPLMADCPKTGGVKASGNEFSSVRNAVHPEVLVTITGNPTVMSE